MPNWRERLLFNQLTRNTYGWLAINIFIELLIPASFEPHMIAVLKIVPLPTSAWGCALELSTVPVLLREVAARIACRI